MKRTTRNTEMGRSFSFSGAGFLGSYHIGASAALRAHGLLPSYTNKVAVSDVTLLGASAGALVAASVFAGSRSEDLMDALCNVSASTSAQPLDALTPGFSLIDTLEPFLKNLLRAPQEEVLMRRVSGSLRIALTAPNLSVLTHRMRANRVIDEFVDVEHLAAACV